MNMSTKYTNINPPKSFMSKTGKIVIRNVPVGIIRALLCHSQQAGDSIRKIGGSASREGYKAILYYLENAKKVNVKNILKSGL
jgi:hypothetical protein